jgi:hypothetical protein
MEQYGLLPVASEELRLKLLKQELKLRKKQPTAWTKTKFRKYANFRTKKKEVQDQTVQQIIAPAI